MNKLVVLIATILSFQSLGQIEEVRRITEQLCAPEFHGRGYVHKGDSLAADFIADEFKKLGVDPINDSYFQDFSFPVNAFPGQMSFNLNGRDLIPGEHFMVDPTSGSHKGVFNALEIDVQIAKDPAKLRAAVDEVLVQKNYKGIILNFAKGDPEDVNALRGLGSELSWLMPVVQVIDRKFTWSVAQQKANFMHVMVQDSVYVSSASIEANIEAQFHKNYSTRNVIAEIPAKKKCAKTVVFTAHYDHLGRMGSETYFPGANDNASGTAMLLTMAKHFLEHPSDYNIVFIAFAGEEAGLVGSQYFVENPMLKLKKIKFLVNLDIMGSGEEGITVVNATLFDKEFKALQEINEEKSLLAKVKARGPAMNSDHYWFTEKGVPAFFIYTMGPNKHYHDVFDRYEELSFVEYHDITALLIEFVDSL